MTTILLSMSGAALGSAAIAILIVFAVLALVYWGCGQFGVPPVALRIIGIVFAIIFLLYSLSRLGLLSSVQI